MFKITKCENCVVCLQFALIATSRLKPDKVLKVRDAGTGGGRRGSCPPCLLLGGAREAKVPLKYKEYYITVSFQGAFS